MEKTFDLCKVPLKKGQVIEYFQNDDRYLFKILNVDGELNTTRKIQFKRLNNTTDSTTPDIGFITLEPTDKLLGVIHDVEAVTDTAPSSPEDWGKTAIKEISRWLMRFPEKGFKAKFQTVLDYMETLGLISPYNRETDKTIIRNNRKILGDLCRNSGGVLLSTAGWIQYIKSADKAYLDNKPLTGNTIINQRTRKINMYHLMKAAEHFMLSGIITDADNVELEYIKNPNYKE